MEQITKIERHSLWQHHSGRKYIVDKLSNQHSTDPEKFPLMVTYFDQQGRDWTRPAASFLQSFTLIGPDHD